MNSQDKRSPAQIANECEMLALATQTIENEPRECAALFMDPAHAIRRVLGTLYRLNHRVHSGYDFNADPDLVTLEVGEVLRDYTPPTEIRCPDFYSRHFKPRNICGDSGVAMLAPTPVPGPALSPAS